MLDFGNRRAGIDGKILNHKCFANDSVHKLLTYHKGDSLTSDKRVLQGRIRYWKIVPDAVYNTSGRLIRSSL